MDREFPSGTAPEPPPLREFWWLQDARWYQGVLRRFGPDAANEINAEALRHVFRHVAQWYARAHGRDVHALSTEEFASWFAGLPAATWSESMLHAEQVPTGEDEFESVITDNFALRMLRAARALPHYRCPCPAMRGGWFEGIGVEVTDERIECELDGADVCRHRAVLRRPAPDG
jgi:hypothetical protein